MTLEEIINATLRGSPYLRSCGHDAVTHAITMALHTIAQKAFNEGGTVSVELGHMAIEVAFKVFELSDHGAIDRMFTAAKERRA